MSSYTELLTLKKDEVLLPKVEMACIVKAEALTEAATPTTNEVTMADSILKDPNGMALRLILYVIANHKGSSLETIRDLPDSDVQTDVDAIIDELITASITS